VSQSCRAKSGQLWYLVPRSRALMHHKAATIIASGEDDELLGLGPGVPIRVRGSAAQIVAAATHQKIKSGLTDQAPVGRLNLLGAVDTPRAQIFFRLRVDTARVVGGVERVVARVRPRSSDNARKAHFLHSPGRRCIRRNR